MLPEDTVRALRVSGAGAPPTGGSYARDCARGEQLGLNDDELAFYGARETDDSAVQILSDEAPRSIARELVGTVRNNVTIDWTLRENVRASLRRHLRLRRHRYPPDKQEQAALTVLEQAPWDLASPCGSRVSLAWLPALNSSRPRRYPRRAPTAGVRGQGRDSLRAVARCRSSRNPRRGPARLR